MAGQWNQTIKPIRKGKKVEKNVDLKKDGDRHMHGLRKQFLSCVVYGSIGILGLLAFGLVVIGGYIVIVAMKAGDTPFLSTIVGKGAVEIIKGVAWLGGGLGFAKLRSSLAED